MDKEPRFKVYLNAARANANMTQEEWAKALGVDAATISRWESKNSQSEPKLSHLQRMSELSGIPAEYIFLRKESTTSTT